MSSVKCTDCKNCLLYDHGISNVSVEGGNLLLHY